MPSKITVRPFLAPDDYEVLAALLTRAGGSPVSATALREFDDQMPPHDELTTDPGGRLTGHGRTRALAVTGDGNPVGWAVAWRAPWTPAGDVVSEVTVDPGVSAAEVLPGLLDHLETWGVAAGADRILSEVADADEHRLDHVRRRGYRIDAHVRTASTELPLDGAESALDHLRAAGLTVTTLAESGGDAVERELHLLYDQTLTDNPGHLDGPIDFDTWREEVVTGQGRRTDWVFLALREAEIVGVTAAQSTDDPHTAYVDYTGVARDWRGRGIARALKLVAAQRLEQSGVRRLRTEVEASNTAMMAVNARLGYTLGTGHYRMVKPL
ncbi:GNAT family N-acetyltransferase [Streptosporangium sp. NPDC000396]|uniref:GNAT family N-acetyltransferase n=1 Tax=Streptosporangium sp. NPDC000396 TaxID=3366185 RepID=UPI0036C198F7